MLNCVIIDDEQYAIDMLTRYIEQVPRLSINQIFLKPLTALEILGNQERIDIIFMDIDMPVISGISLAKLLKYKTQKLIFTTAYPQYEHDAYEVGGDAYLLKPFTLNRFVQIINNLFP